MINPVSDISWSDSAHAKFALVLWRCLVVERNCIYHQGWRTNIDEHASEDVVPHVSSPFCGHKNKITAVCQCLSSSEELTDVWLFNHLLNDNLKERCGFYLTFRKYSSLYSPSSWFSLFHLRGVDCHILHWLWTTIIFCRGSEGMDTTRLAVQLSDSWFV